MATSYDFPPNINNLTLVEAVKVLILIWTGGSGTVPSTTGLTDTQLRASPVPVSLPAGTVRTFSLTAATGNGSVSAGAKSVAFSSSSDFSGTIAGAAFGASQTTGASADGADTIGAIAYTRAAGTLYIATLT